MKILIAYDGSESADAALADLSRAGLPDDVEAAVVSVAEQWLPTPRSFGMVDLHLKENLSELTTETLSQAQKACARLSLSFPRWQLKAEAMLGSPARAILEKADNWKPALIVAGSEGQTALGRFILGSVAHKLAAEAHCSVRIARSTTRAASTPIRVIIGVDGSPGSELAVAIVAQRSWRADTEARIVTADFPFPPPVAGRQPGPLVEWAREERERIRAAIAVATETLQAKGLTVSSLIEDERPGKLLCREAERWEADCIFVGANQLGRVDRFLLGSISASVAARAHCSVEIARAEQ